MDKRDVELLKSAIELFIANDHDPKEFEKTLKKMEGYYEIDNKRQ